ncbi:MAG TPA: YXWGXW repeat-containing protein [Byssovorax sp.]
MAPGSRHAALLGPVFCVALVALTACAASSEPLAPLPEVRYPAPAPGLVWIDGSWHKDGARDVWLPGHWETPRDPYK